LGHERSFISLAKKFQLGIVSSNQRQNIDDFFEKEGVDLNNLFAFVHLEKIFLVKISIKT